jgi:hypothetical protein
LCGVHNAVSMFAAPRALCDLKGQAARFSEATFKPLLANERFQGAVDELLLRLGFGQSQRMLHEPVVNLQGSPHREFSFKHEGNKNIRPGQISVGTSSWRTDGQGLI